MLADRPLPEIDSQDDKDGRGRVLIVGGEVAIPGAVVLAGIAALRAGAGKLQIATCRSIAPMVGITVPEALCLGLEETEERTISPSAVDSVTPLADHADAILIGPGMTTSDSNSRFAAKLVQECVGIPIVLDAGALGLSGSNRDALHPFVGKAIITPHAGEMAKLLQIKKDEVASDPETISAEVAKSLGAVVALKGADTFIASPDGEVFRYESGDVGLATSGSGDTLAGIVVGLLARGCDPLDATLWAVFLHGAAGNALAKRIGRIGYLARELLDEIPAIMNRA